MHNQSTNLCNRLAMAEQHTAEERYNAFENLRSRFGGEDAAATAGGAAGGDKERTAQQVKGKRRASRTDPRSNAPPLVPLVEEENPVDGVYNNRPLVKGKWKYSTTTKSNHLNGPDFDAVETASVASCSSAYSSKSESSVLSPPCGSTAELSDAGSCDTFQEYDIFSQRRKKLQLNHLPTGSRSPNPEVNDPISSPDTDMPDNLVQDHVRGWNKVIGEWKFVGMSPFPSPQSPQTFKVTNEVRLPTPVWTPQGSTDNLLYDSESRSSLFSSEDDYSWLQERLGLHQGRSRRSNSTSSLASACQTISTVGGGGDQEKSGSEELGVGEGVDGERMKEGDHLEKESGNSGSFKSHEKERREDSETEGTSDTKGETNVDHKTTETLPDHEKQSHSSKPARTPTPSHEGSTGSHRAPAKLMRVTDRIRLLRSQSASNLQAPRPPPVVHSPSGKSSKWLEAYNKSKTLKTVQESAGQEEGKRGRGERSKTTDMKVTQRAQLFGETKRCLPRRQSCFALGENRGLQN